MLLTAHPDGFDLSRNRFCLAKRASDAARGGVAPGMWMLLLRARRKIRYQIIFLRGGSEDFAVLRIHYDHFCRLGAAVYADQENSHYK